MKYPKAFHELESSYTPSAGLSPLPSKALPNFGPIYGHLHSPRQLDGWKSAKLAGARKAQEIKETEEAAELGKEQPKPAFVNASWVWLADPKKPECEEKEITEGVLFDSVWCKVDTQGLMPGDSVTISIFVKGVAGEGESMDWPEYPD
jgi:hypothetical protein